MTRQKIGTQHQELSKRKKPSCHAEKLFHAVMFLINLPQAVNFHAGDTA